MSVSRSENHTVCFLQFICSGRKQKVENGAGETLRIFVKQEFQTWNVSFDPCPSLSFITNT